MNRFLMVGVTLQILVPSPVADVNSPRKIGLGLISLKIESGSS